MATPFFRSFCSLFSGPIEDAAVLALVVVAAFDGVLAGKNRKKRSVPPLF